MKLSEVSRETWGHFAGWAPMAFAFSSLTTGQYSIKIAGSLLAGLAFVALVIAAVRLFPLPEKPGAKDVPAKEYWSIYGGLWAAGSAVLLLVGTSQS